MQTRDFWIAFLLGVLGFLSVAFTVNGPGLTWDEANFIPSSLSYLDWFREIGRGEALSSEAITRHWMATREHPPFAKLLSGLTIVIFHRIAGLIASARLSVAFSFSLLLIMVYVLTRGICSWKSALLSALSLMVMPRLFGHAHLASLDIPMSLMSVLVVFSFIRGLNSWRWSLLTGLFFGLALSTKLNALFLPLPLFIWAHLYCRRQYANNLMAMVFISPLIFLAIWPWLWVDTPYRILEYLALKVERSAIPVYYLGNVYGKTPPPWHYPFLMMAVTIPPVILLSSLAGLVKTIIDKNKIGMLLVFNALFPLFIMALPNTPKYDGVRLFLPAFPFLAILSGIGLEWLTESMGSLLLREFHKRRSLPLRKFTSLPLILALLIITVSALPLIAIHPHQLSYYNCLVGGLKGARRLGFETTYWGDTCTQDVLNYLNEKGGKVSFFPVGSNVVPLLRLSGLLTPNVEVVPIESGDADYLVLNCRQGFFDEKIWELYRNKEPIVEGSTFYNGVPLTAIYQLK